MFSRSCLRCLTYPASVVLLLVLSAPLVGAQPAQAGSERSAPREAAPPGADAGVESAAVRAEDMAGSLIQRERRIVMLDSLPAAPPVLPAPAFTPVVAALSNPAPAARPLMVAPASPSHGKWIAIGAAVGAVVATVLFVGRNEAAAAPGGSNLSGLGSNAGGITISLAAPGLVPGGR